MIRPESLFQQGFYVNLFLWLAALANLSLRALRPDPTGELAKPSCDGTSIRGAGFLKFPHFFADEKDDQYWQGKLCLKSTTGRLCARF